MGSVTEMLQRQYNNNSFNCPFYSAPAIGEQRMVMTISVCLCVWQHISSTADLVFTDLLCVLLVAVPLSSSGGIAVYYVLLVVWIFAHNG